MGKNRQKINEAAPHGETSFCEFSALTAKLSVNFKLSKQNLLLSCYYLINFSTWAVPSVKKIAIR